jgi:hypothetical protein
LPFLVVGEDAAICHIKECCYFGVYLIDILSARCSTSGILKRESIVWYLNHRYLIINNRYSIIKLKIFLGYIAEAAGKTGMSKRISGRVRYVLSGADQTSLYRERPIGFVLLISFLKGLGDRWVELTACMGGNFVQRMSAGACRGVGTVRSNCIKGISDRQDS